jgi:hypothetical protein
MCFLEQMDTMRIKVGSPPSCQLPPPVCHPPPILSAANWQNYEMDPCIGLKLNSILSITV